MGKNKTIYTILNAMIIARQLQVFQKLLMYTVFMQMLPRDWLISCLR